MSKIVDLRNEEKKLRLTISAMKARIEELDEMKELAQIKKELGRTQAELDKTRSVLSNVKKESKRVLAETRKMLSTLDEKNVYLDEVLPSGRSSILVGKIEGEKFVWHRPYVETYRDGVVG